MRSRSILFLVFFCCSTPALATGPATNPDFGNSLIINGIDAYAWMQPNVSGAAEGTVEVWIRSASSATGQVWSGSIGQPGARGDWTLLGTHSSSPDLSMGIYAGVWRWAGNHPIPAGVWTHVAATWSAEGITLFVDGQEIGTNSYGGGVPDYSTELIGASSWGLSFQGALDDLRVWDHARTQSEIQAAMNEPLPAAVYESAGSGLLAYYRFDSFEDLGGADGVDDLRDFSVHGNHADAEGDAVLSAGIVAVDEISWSSLKGVYSR
jgi:hypothetical protein